MPGAGHDVDDSARHVGRNVLRQQRHLGARRNEDLAAIGLDIAQQQSHECRLARPIAPQQTDLLSRFDLARDAIEQRRSAEPEIDISQGNQCHENRREVLANLCRREAEASVDAMSGPEG